MRDFQELYAIMFLNLMSAMEYGKITHMTLIYISLLHRLVDLALSWETLKYHIASKYVLAEDLRQSCCFDICFLDIWVPYNFSLIN